MRLVDYCETKQEYSCTAPCVNLFRFIKDLSDHAGLIQIDFE